LDYLKSPFIDTKLSSNSRVIQFFSVDPDYPDPPQFASVEKIRGRFAPYGWKDKLREQISENLSVELHKDLETDKFLSCIYEAVENTKKHGRLKKQDEIKADFIPGPRYFSVKRHVRSTKGKNDYLASRFPELEKYLKVVTKLPVSNFLEVCISDGGQGVANHFRAFKTDSKAEELSDFDLINYIVKNRLSTDQVDQSSGEGFRTMLEATQLMRGFISLRCNKTWMYFFDGEKLTGEANKGNLKFKRVETRFNLQHISGTHINILFPVVMKRKR